MASPAVRLVQELDVSLRNEGDKARTDGAEITILSFKFIFEIIFYAYIFGSGLMYFRF